MAKRPRIAVKMDVEGVPGVLDVLHRLPGAVQRKVIRSAVGAGASILLGSARSNVPVFSGNLHKSLKKKVGTNKRKDGAWSVVGAEYGGKGAHAHLVEFGTAERRTPKEKDFLQFFTLPGKRGTRVRAASVAAMPASGFMERSLQESKHHVIHVVQRKVLDGIDTEIGKLRRKGG